MCRKTSWRRLQALQDGCRGGAIAARRAIRRAFQVSCVATGNSVLATQKLQLCCNFDDRISPRDGEEQASRALAAKLAGFRMHE